MALSNISDAACPGSFVSLVLPSQPRVRGGAEWHQLPAEGGGFPMGRPRVTKAATALGKVSCSSRFCPLFFWGKEERSSPPHVGRSHPTGQS